MVFVEVLWYTGKDDQHGSRFEERRYRGMNHSQQERAIEKECVLYNVQNKTEGSDRVAIVSTPCCYCQSLPVVKPALVKFELEQVCGVQAYAGYNVHES